MGGVPLSSPPPLAATAALLLGAYVLLAGIWTVIHADH